MLQKAQDIYVEKMQSKFMNLKQTNRPSLPLFESDHTDLLLKKRQVELEEKKPVRSIQMQNRIDKLNQFRDFEMSLTMQQGFTSKRSKPPATQMLVNPLK